MGELETALRIVETFASGDRLTQRIARLESKLGRKRKARVGEFLASEGIHDGVVEAAMKIKRVTGQIDVVIHAVGILVSLPYVLDPGDRIRSVSLGAGNTGRDFDLETDKQVAEFKFIKWRGGPESIRQNQLFLDLFKLVDEDSDRRRCLYVVGKKYPMKFLHADRSLKSVLSKNQAIRERFLDRYGTRYSVVSEYFEEVSDLVEIIDLADVVPAFAEA